MTTQTLPYDVSRCTGRLDLLPDGEWCAQRGTYQRHLAWIILDRQDGIPDYRGIPVMIGRHDCGMRIEADGGEQWPSS